MYSEHNIPSNSEGFVQQTVATYPVQRGRIFFALLLACLMCSSVRAQQAEALTQAVQAKPGTVVTTAIRVTNTSVTRQTFESELHLPKGWRLISREAPFTLESQQSDARLVSVSIPAETPAGLYTLRYAVKATSTPETLTEATVAVTVTPVLLLEIRHIEAPRYVVAGKAYTSIFGLTNKGNVRSRVKLRSRAEPFVASIDENIVVLAGRETRLIPVTVLTPSDVEDRVHHSLELYATLEQDTTIEVRASSLVDVVPRVAAVEERYLELPVSVRLRQVGQNSISAQQVELAGYGSFTQDHHDRVEFLFRSPETQTKSALGQRDEYRINYQTSGLELYAGDQNFALSPLTEVGRFGSGVGGRVSLGNLKVGGFFNETRYYLPKNKEIGGFANVSLFDGVTAGVNYLKKSEQTQSEVYSFRGIASFLRNNELDFEYGIGSRDDIRQNGYAVRLGGRERWISYDVRFVNADKDFPGYYRDLSFKSMTLNLLPSANMRFEAYYQDEERNLGRDTNQVYAPYSRFYQFGVGYSNLASLHFRTTQQEDRLPVPKYRRKEDVIQARTGFNFESVSFYANADFGTTTDLLLDKLYPSSRYALNIGFQPFAGHNYTAAVEYSKDRNIFTDEDQKRFSGTLTAFIFFGSATQMQLNLFTSRLDVSSVEQSYTALEGTLEHVFPFAHKIAVRARQTAFTPSTGDNAIDYHVEYSIPIGIPLKRLTTSGQIKGRVVDERGKGIENVLLDAGGSAAVTDKEVSFLFPDVTFLQVDRTSIGLDRVTLQPIPMEIAVRGGEESFVELTVVRSATITGSILLFGPRQQTESDTSSAMVQLQEQSGVFLELASGTEVHRRVSDNRGRFVFNDLRPGRWELKNVGGNVPLYHNFEKDSFVFHLKPGSLEVPVFNILPRKRQIRIIQEGSLVQEVKPKADTTKQIQPSQPTAADEQCIVVYNSARKGYVIQLSSWTSRTKANRLATHAKESFPGYEPFVQTVNLPKLGIRHRVQIGTYPTERAAEAACNAHLTTHN
ncbi:MAG: hypothetical protein HW374_192 [Bacteroidetes bacterium]|nr:hypothetical protein [Bacteroidota bacterium]